MIITFYGHACFSINIGELTLLVDPFISGNPMANHIDISKIKADYILVSHAHQDHILDVELIGKESEAIVVSNFEICCYFESLGLRTHPLNQGGHFHHSAFSLKYTSAMHSSSFPDGRNGGLAGGFILSAPKKSLYIAGDTALFSDMKLLPLWTKLDAAILPIGDTFTMGIQDALIAADFIECSQIIGCHYDTFPPIVIDKTQAKKAFSQQDKSLLLPDIGESITI